jgi:hypothetical protein
MIPNKTILTLEVTTSLTSPDIKDIVQTTMALTEETLLLAAGMLEAPTSEADQFGKHSDLMARLSG